MTDAELTQIERRAARATPGLWEKELDNYPLHKEPVPVKIRVPSIEGRQIKVDLCRCYTQTTQLGYDRHLDVSANAEFIAHARADVPKLIAHIRMLQRKLDTVNRSQTPVEVK